MDIFELLDVQLHFTTNLLYILMLVSIYRRMAAKRKNTVNQQGKSVYTFERNET